MLETTHFCGFILENKLFKLSNDVKRIKRQAKRIRNYESYWKFKAYPTKY